MFVFRVPNALVLAVRRRAYAVFWGRPVWWLPRWERGANADLCWWYAGWFLVGFTVVTYRGDVWPALKKRRAGSVSAGRRRPAASEDR